MQNKKLVLMSLVSLFLIFLGSAYIYKNNQSEKFENMLKTQSSIFQREHSFVIGNSNAKVQLVEFFDPACETCAQFHPYIKEIMKQNEGKIKLVLRYAPFHKNSDYAVMMLEGAREQGLFLEALELMFETQEYWVVHHEVNPKVLWEILKTIKNIDMGKIEQYMNSEKVNQIIKQDLEDAKKLEANKTPSYFVNGKPLQEFGLENLKRLINSEL